MATIAAASTDSIFTSVAHKRGGPGLADAKRLEPIWEDPHAQPARRLESIRAVPATPSSPSLDARRAAIDAQLVAILDAPLALGETTLEGYRRKEHELGAIFGALSIVESHVMHARLANPKPTDPLATRFARLVVERRARLLTFIADARRRAALAGR